MKIQWQVKLSKTEKVKKPFQQRFRGFSKSLRNTYDLKSLGFNGDEIKKRRNDDL